MAIITKSYKENTRPQHTSDYMRDALADYFFQVGLPLSSTLAECLLSTDATDIHPLEFTYIPKLIMRYPELDKVEIPCNDYLPMVLRSLLKIVLFSE